MPHVRVEHTTVYRYAEPVRLTDHRLMLRPHDSHDLRLNDATLGLTPPAAQLRWAHDVFGNSICFVDFAGARTDALRARMDAIEKRNAPVPEAVKSEFVKVQQFVDEIAQTFGDSEGAPRWLDGETVPDYERRLLTKYKAHSPAWKDKDYARAKSLSRQLLEWAPEDTLGFRFLARAAVPRHR